MFGFQEQGWKKYHTGNTISIPGPIQNEKKEAKSKDMLLMFENTVHDYTIYIAGDGN